MSKQQSHLPPSDWKQMTLGQVCECILGGTPSTEVPMFWGGPIPWMASGDVHLRRIHDVPGRITETGLRCSNATLINPPAVAVGLAGQGKTRGTVALILCSLSTNQSIALLRANGSDLRTDYLFHNLDRRYEELRARSSGGGRGGLSKSILEAVPIDLPPINEQQQISKILDTLDTAICETESLIDKLKAIKQGLLHDLLTRGIEANGQLRPPQSEAPQLYKKSPLGWIPIEWEASTVETEFCVESGITLGAHRVPRSNPKQYLRVANVHRARLLLEDIATLEASDTEASQRELRPGDLLVVEGHASTEEIGRCAMADESVRGMLFQNHLFRLRTKRLLSVYGLLWMNSAFVRAYWRCEAATSSGLNTINRTKLNRLYVAVPPLCEQEKIVSGELGFASRLSAEEQTLEKLKREKIALREDLLTGRVRVVPLLESMQQAAAQTRP